MRACIALLLLVLTSSAYAQQCAEPHVFHDSVSLIQRTTSSTVQKGSKLYTLTSGVRGTVWTLSQKHLVTADHVARGLSLNKTNWTTVTQKRATREGSPSQSQSIQLRVVEDIPDRDLAVLEVAGRMLKSTPLPLRTTASIPPNERVIALGYPSGLLRYAAGKLLYDVPEILPPTVHESWKTYAGFMLLELDRNGDRLVVTHGASGGPIVDCKGRVVAIISQIMHATPPEAIAAAAKQKKKAQYVPSKEGTPTTKASPARLLSRYVPQT